MNIYLLIFIILVILLAVIFIVGAVKSPKKAKIWLRAAVLEAEKVLGTDTGKAKLQYVYNLFVEKFKFLSIFISFDLFQEWVNEALKWMDQQLLTNPNLDKYVGVDPEKAKEHYLK